jgi:predicted DNA-binding protein (UPF0251 family)
LTQGLNLTKIVMNICSLLEYVSFMPRPFKNRCVTGMPGSVMYKPAGIPARLLETVVLTLDEFETFRLLDYQGMSQEQVAQMMKVSRPTVTRIYANARKKIAMALTEGKAICIQGGPVASPPQVGPIQPAGGRGRGCGRGWRGGRGRQ